MCSSDLQVPAPAEVDLTAEATAGAHPDRGRGLVVAPGLFDGEVAVHTEWSGRFGRTQQLGEVHPARHVGTGEPHPRPGIPRSTSDEELGRVGGVDQAPGGVEAQQVERESTARRRDRSELVAQARAISQMVDGILQMAGAWGNVRREVIDVLRGVVQIGGSAQIVRDQTRVYDEELPTDGYAIAKFFASYSFNAGGVLNTMTARLDNATDRLYRNHLNYLKDVLPEMGRSFRLVYSVGF